MTTPALRPTLYSGPLSMFGAKVEIAAREKGIAFDLVMVPFDFERGYAPKHPEVVRINPKQQVPVLVDGSVEVFDSTQIFEYLEDRWPETPLWPRAVAARAEARKLELCADEVFFPHVIRLMGLRATPDPVDTPEWQRARAGIEAYYERMNRLLGDREYLAGEFSCADIAFYMAQLFAARHTVPIGAGHRDLLAWRERMIGRPPVRTVVGAMTANLRSQGSEPTVLPDARFGPTNKTTAEVDVKSYNVIGYAIVLVYAAACMSFAPPALGPWLGLAIGAAYFIACWFVGGVYLSCVIHMGIAHRALDYKPWFVKTITVVNNTFGVYINPVTWVNRHRLHHAFSDHPGDPNKVAADGWWRTLRLCLLPYECKANLATDEIFRSWPFRLVAHPLFVVAAQGFSFWLLWRLLGDLRFAAVMWIVFRVFALWINMIQNYWTHDRRFGSRRYDDERDNAMNIGEWLPVTATFSACLQNNHHHSPGLLRLSHDESEYDLGFAAVKAMKALGLVRATDRGAELPQGVALSALNF